MKIFFFDSSALVKTFFTFVCADDRLVSASEAEGMLTENPNSYS
jgi:hypothetical protein